MGRFLTFSGRESNCQFESWPFFFAINLCFKCPNGSFQPTLDIYVPWAFQWYKELPNPMGFDPCNHSLKIGESIETPTSKWELTWKCECSFSHTLLHSQPLESMKCDSHASLMARTLTSPLLWSWAQGYSCDNEPNKAFWNLKWTGLFLESFKGHMLSKNKVQWLDLPSHLWPPLVGLPLAKMVQVHYDFMVKYPKPCLSSSLKNYSWFL